MLQSFKGLCALGPKGLQPIIYSILFYSNAVTILPHSVALCPIRNFILSSSYTMANLFDQQIFCARFCVWYG